ncbi:MAG: hypothetical protein LC791_08400 [Acidobacteria bacterium]|nr:hypothetical protein [Acidobacteriota bacterium]
MYSTPELVLLGPAPTLVLGVPGGEDDNGSSMISRPLAGIALGLDE